MARGDWNTSGITNLKNRSNAKVGFEWRYANTEQEAINDNQDIIEIRPFIYRASSSTTAYNNDTQTSYLKYSYGTYTSSNQNMSTAYNYEDCSSLNTRYYAERRSLSSGHPFRSASGGVQIGSYYGFQITIPHKDDGTQDDLTITWFFNGADTHGDATAKTTISLEPITRTPTINITSISKTSSSITFNVESGNGIQLDGVRVEWTDSEGNNHTDEFIEENISSVTIPIEGYGTLNPKTEYTFTLTGYNAENDAWSTQTTEAPVTTSPKPIQVRSINYTYPSSSNSADLDTWTVQLLADLRYGDGNSLSDLESLQYVVYELDGPLVSRQYRYLNNYATPVTVSDLKSSTTYRVNATAYTRNASMALGLWINFTTPAKSRKIWIKNSQGEWIQGSAYIKTPNGWKQAIKVYYKTNNGWTESVN